MLGAAFVLFIAKPCKHASARTNCTTVRIRQTEQGESPPPREELQRSAAQDGPATLTAWSRPLRCGAPPALVMGTVSLGANAKGYLCTAS